MFEGVIGIWRALSVPVQDALVLVALLLPVLLLGVGLIWGFAPWRLITALLRRYLLVNLLFLGLIAISVGMSIALIAQERGLREGSARAAEKFDLIVAAPGSELTMMFAAVYLEPSAVPLLGGEVFNALVDHPRVELAAPIAFGDSHEGAPVVGTTGAFVEHLSDGAVSGDVFQDAFDAVAGANLPYAEGYSFVPAHGLGDAAEDGLHGDRLTIRAKLPLTGSPWDNAILTPVEGVWLAHSMGTGKALGNESLGPPYDPTLFPGTPAVLVRAGNLPATYALRSEFDSRADTMAFFPGTVLARLHNVLGDVRQAMSILSTLTQGLVAVSVLTGLFILSWLYRPQLVLLRTLGAPVRFIVSVVWAQAALLLSLGTALGVILGVGVAAILSRIVTGRTGILIEASLSWRELHLAAGFLCLSAGLALLLGLHAARSARRDRQ